MKAFKKRGKYRKRNKSGDVSINSVTDNDISGSIIGAIDLRIVHHDENSMYLADFQIFSSPQSHTNTNMHHNHCLKIARPPEITFDGFSQLSFDWESSHGGASNGTMYANKQGKILAKIIRIQCQQC